MMIITFLWQDDASAAEPVRADGKLLLARYAAIEAKLKSNKFGAPIYLESSEQKGSSRVDVYGVFDHGFKVVQQALQSPANWCDIMPTHINIKACTYDESDNEWRLTLYSGRKFYQPPADAFRLILKFHLAEQQADHLASDNGPEFVSRAILRWLAEANIDTALIDPGKPWQNGSNEPFNGKFRDECLGMQWFKSRIDAKILIEQFRREYNEVRPHSSLANLTPLEFKRSLSSTHPEGAIFQE